MQDEHPEQIRQPAGRRQLAGPEAIGAALERGEPLRLIVLDDEADSEATRALLAPARAAGVPVQTVGTRHFARLCPSEAAGGAVALVGDGPLSDPAEVLAREGPTWLLTSIAYPGNAGSAIRTAEVSGGAGVFLDTDFDHAKRREAVRASMRADRFFPVLWMKSDDVISAARQAGRRVIGVEDVGAHPPWTVDLSGPVLFVVGGEAEGIAAATLERCDHVVRIPMAGFLRTYNLQAAVAITAAERMRQLEDLEDLKSAEQRKELEEPQDLEAFEEQEEAKPAGENVPFRSPFIPLHTLARSTIGLLIATMAVAWIAVGVDLSEMRLLLQATAGSRVAFEAREAQFTTNEILFWVQAVLFAATAVSFLVWLFQARVNLRALGIRRPSYSRDWVVWSFLVPLVNLFRPYQVIREIWQASNPGSRDAFNWRSLPVPRLLLIWWVLFVGWGTLELMALLTELGAGVHMTKLQLSRSFATLADVSAAFSAFLACLVVTRISQAQQEKWDGQRRGEALDFFKAPF